MTKEECINQMIAVAQKEIGYIEKKNKNSLDDKKDNAGGENFTKYWRDVKQDYQGQPWCAAFVSWVLMKAFGLEKAKKLLKHWPYVYCPTLGNLFRRYANPQKGDIVIFYRSGRFRHTGIVTKVQGDQFWAIEGNTSSTSGIVENGGSVCEKSYYNRQLPGTKFCRLDWSVMSTVSSTEKIKAPQTRALSLKFPQVAKGYSGVAVSMLQTMIGTPVTGIWKEEDEKVFKEFQKNTKQTQDGICGANGWTAVAEHLKANTWKK